VTQQILTLYSWNLIVLVLGWTLDLHFFLLFAARDTVSDLDWGVGAPGVKEDRSAVPLESLVVGMSAAGTGGDAGGGAVAVRVGAAMEKLTAE
jgi:hypothetical protein